MSRNSNKTITIERSVISARSREQGSAKERVSSAYTNKRQHTQGYEDMQYDEQDEFDIKEDNDNDNVHAKQHKQEVEYEGDFYEDNEEIVDNAKMDEDNKTKSNNHYKNATTTETYGQIATTS